MAAVNVLKPFHQRPMCICNDRASVVFFQFANATNINKTQTDSRLSEAAVDFAFIFLSRRFGRTMMGMSGLSGLNNAFRESCNETRCQNWEKYGAMKKRDQSIATFFNLFMFIFSLLFGC